MFVKGTLLFYFLSFIFGILFINSFNYLFLLGFIILAFFAFKKLNYKYLLLMIVIFSFSCIYRVNKKPIIQNYYVNNSFIVTEKKENYLIVKSDKVLYYVKAKQNIYNKNDILLIEGNVTEIEKDLDLDIFDFSDYLKKKRVYYEIDVFNIKLKEKGIDVQGNIVDFLTCKLENETYTMVKMLLFNDKNVDDEIYNSLLNINALHLFVVSGFHISFLFSLIDKCLNKFLKISKYIGLLICFIYVFILRFSISSSRALFSLVCSIMLSKYFNDFDSFSLSGIMFLLIEPLNVYNYSFILTYVISFAIAFSKSFLKKQNKIMQAILMSFICLLCTIPIQLVINYKINFISFFTNMILNYLVIVIFILSIISVIISFLNGNAFSFIYQKFFDLIKMIDVKSYALVFGSMKPWMIILYYIIFIIILIYIEKAKIVKFCVTFSFLIIYMILIYNRGYFINYQQVTFLNVYQGDCTILVDKYNQGVMLIDTGGIINYDIASKKIIPYLEYHGIKKIDKIVITHEDYDHCGALENLEKMIIVKEVIKENNFEKITCGSMEFTNLNANSDYDNNNDNSIVLYGNVCGENMLFMGDASIKIEDKIIDTYGYFNVDILHVGHHGSKTSSSFDFINTYKPKYAIISVGKNNKYGHPNDEVLDILNNCNCIIYRTDINGTIKITSKTGKSYFFKFAK